MVSVTPHHLGETSDDAGPLDAEPGGQLMAQLCPGQVAGGLGVVKEPGRINGAHHGVGPGGDVGHDLVAVGLRIERPGRRMQVADRHRAPGSLSATTQADPEGVGLEVGHAYGDLGVDG